MAQATPLAEAPLTIRLFGPMDVQIGGNPLPRLRSKKGLWILALLILRNQREVQRDWLAGTLWPESDQPQALANLRLALTDLRKVMGEEAARILSPTTQTLRLDTSGAAIDLLEFDAALQRGEPASLEKAANLYRGPLLEGCIEDWAIGEQQRREEDYLRTLETLAARAQAIHDSGSAVRWLRLAIAQDPLREEFQRSLLLALADAGDFAAVTQTYRELRQRLWDEMGAEPDVETKRLYQRLKAEADKQAQSAHPATPAASAPSPAPTLSKPGHLPIPLTSFVGREEAVGEVRALLMEHRLVTLMGTGGVGKTRLSLQVAQSLREDYPDGVWFIDLSALTDGNLVPQTVAGVLGLREEAGRSLMDTLLTALRERLLLLILDNCEHLPDACARLADNLLQGCRRLKVLATSRQALGVFGEHTWRVPSLPLPDLSQHPSREELMRSDAIRLLTERATAVTPHFTLTEENLTLAAQLCQRLDGIPLAIELAAARMRTLSLPEILARLDDRFRLLTGGSRTAMPRHQTLRALLDWSYDLLNPQERLLLQRLAVFSGGWTLAAAEEVCTESPEGAKKPPIEEWEVLDLLVQLVDKSLVIVEEQRTQTRYRLLESVRRYAWEKLLETGEGRSLRERHRRYFRDYAEEAEALYRNRQQVLYLERLEGEHDNLRVAIAPPEPQDSPPQDETGLRIAGAMSPFWRERGFWTEGRQRLSQTLEQTPEAEPGVRAKALHAAGTLAFRQGDYGAARPLLEESLFLREETGDREGMAGSQMNLGIVAYHSGDWDRAKDCFETSLRLREELNDPPGTADNLVWLSVLARTQGDYTAAQQHQQESLTIYRKRNDELNVARALLNMGVLAHEQGDYGRACVYYQESLTIFREKGITNSMVRCLNNLGNALRDQGDYETAQPLLEESLSLSRELGDESMVAHSLHGLGLVAMAQGEYAIARMLWEESLSHFHELQESVGIAAVFEGFAGLALAEGQPAQAAELLRAASALREAAHTPLPPAERREVERKQEQVRAALGEDVFATAWTQEAALATIAVEGAEG